MFFIACVDLKSLIFLEGEKWLISTWEFHCENDILAKYCIWLNPECYVIWITKVKWTGILLNLFYKCIYKNDLNIDIFRLE